MPSRSLTHEFTNAVFQGVRQGRWSFADAAEALKGLFALELESHLEQPSLHLRALELARQDELPATYDAQFLALAEALNCDLWTADERFVRRLAGRTARVRPLTSFLKDE